MKSNRIIYISIIFGLLFFIPSIIYSNINLNENLVNNGGNLGKINEPSLKDSGAWDLTGTPIIINGNAGWVNVNSSYDWVNGSGTKNYPYIIENVTINARGSGSGISIIGSDVYFIIKNCTIYNSGPGSFPDWDAGIKLFSTKNGKLIKNNLNNNYYGISLYQSENNTIFNNTVNNNHYSGIYLPGYSSNNNITKNIVNNNTQSGILISTYSDNNTISLNTIIGNQDGIMIMGLSNNNKIYDNNLTDNSWYGIHLNIVYNATLKGNNMERCGVIIYGNAIEEYTSHTIDTSNKVNGKNIYHYVNEINLGANDFINAGQVLLINSSNSIVSSLNLSPGSIGIYLAYSDNNTIFNNTANDNTGYGIHLMNSNNNKIYNNTVKKNDGSGIGLYYSDNNKISNNTVNENDNSGIEIYSSDNNIIFNNTAHNNKAGIYLQDSNNATLSSNEMVACGLAVMGSSDKLASHNIDTTNLVNEKPIYYYIYEQNLDNSNFTNAGQVLLISSSNSIISGLIISYGSIGIFLAYSDNISISNTITNNNNEFGIFLYKSDENTISVNDMSDNGENGIKIQDSNKNTVIGNDIGHNNNSGIYITADSDLNRIVENYIVYNDYYGIEVILTGSSVPDGTYIVRNFIWKNGGGNVTDQVKFIGGTVFLQENVIGEIQDTDGDGLSDYDEIMIYGTNYKSIDTDFDNLLDAFELNYGTDPLDADSDDDGLSDYEEILVYATNPLDPDTDSDGLNDYDEIFTYLTDPTKLDTDGDKLNDTDEITIYGTNPLDPDTDSDGLNDYDEIFTYLTNATNPDTDFDGYSDGVEVVNGWNPNDPNDPPLNLYLDITNQSFSMEEFNITFFVYNDSGYGIDFTTTQILWNRIDVSTDVQNLNNGLYFIILNPISVIPGEDPILLNMSISAGGYQDRHLEIYLAIDLDIISGTETFPLFTIIIISSAIVGGIGLAGVIMVLLRKRKGLKEII